MNCAAKSVLMCDGKESVACCADSLHYPAALMQDAIKRHPPVVVTFAMSYIVVNEPHTVQSIKVISNSEEPSEWEATLERVPHKAQTKLLHRQSVACVSTHLKRRSQNPPCPVQLGVAYVVTENLSKCTTALF